MQRRDFIKICGSALALASARPQLLSAEPGTLRKYERVKLVDPDGRPVTAGGLARDVSYIFFYPFVGTPCYLIRLGTITRTETLQTEDGRSYEWRGGIGPEGNIVAFSAICTHLLTHPTSEISFINYHAEADKLSGRENVITCCAHGSVFDPARGAKVIKGPATQPLTTIALEHDGSSDELYALGTRGAEVFGEFFDDFKGELREEFGRGNARNIARGTTTVRPLTDYTGHEIIC